MELHDTLKKTPPSFGRRLVIALCPCVLLAGIYCLFTPLSILSVEATSFSYTAADMLWYCLAVFFGVAAGLTLLTAALRGEGFDGIFVLLTALSVGSVVQRLWLNGELTEYLCNNIDWRAYRWPAVWNLLIWLAVAAALYAAFRLLGKRRYKVFCGLCAALVVFLTATTAAESVKNGGKTVPQADCYCDTTGMEIVSARENVLVFVLDEFSLSDLDRVSDAYPGSLSDFSGFVAYAGYRPDGGALRTLLSDDADGWYALLKEKGYARRLLEKFPTAYRYAELSERFDNIVPLAEGQRMEPKAVREAVMATAFYQDAPLLLKPVFRRSPGNLRDAAELMYGLEPKQLSEEEGAPLVHEPLWEWEGATLYAALMADGVASMENGLFAVYHLQGGSEPYVLNDAVAYEWLSFADASRLSQTYATLCIVKQMMAELRELDAYDAATIVIVGNGGTDGEPPLLMVKERDAGDAAWTVCTAPVGDAQLLPALFAAADPAGERGRTLSEAVE